MVYQILVVEDKEDYFNRYQRALEDAGLEGKFNLINKKNKFDAEEILKTSQKFDAAIMDLQIPSDPEDKNSDIHSGTALLKETLSRGDFPVVVVSAHSESLDMTSRDLPASLKKWTREGTCYSEVVEYLHSLESLFDILETFQGAREELKKDFTSTFWNLSAHWGNFESKFQDKTNLPAVMKRHISNYLVEKWTADDDCSKLHYSEFYISPSLRERLHTGDIVQHADRKWIIVTAPCDLSNDGNPEEITMLECVPMDYNATQIQDILKPFLESGSQKKKDKAMENLSKFFTDPSASKHFLPAWNANFTSHFIQFKNIKTLPYETNQESLKNSRITSISSYFIPSIMQRYGAYVSRLGQPVVHTEDYLTYLLALAAVMAESKQ